MKFIYTAKELGAMQSMSDSVLKGVCEYEEVEFEQVKLLETFSQEENITILPDGSIEIEADEEMVLKILAFYEKRIIAGLPLIMKLAKAIDPILHTGKAMINMFINMLNKETIEEGKQWLIDTKQDVLELFNS